MLKAVGRVMAITVFFCLTLAFAKELLASSFPSEYEPPNGKGRVVVVVSGRGGPGDYRDTSKDLAGQGYYVVLVDGNDFVKKGNGGALFKDVLANARMSPHALPGKVAVVAFSLGGVSGLSFAARMPELVSAVVVYYPVTSYITDVPDFVSKIKVSTLMFAGGRDTQRNCCVIETARRLAIAAKVIEGKALLEVVEYPEAGHGFNIKFGKEWRKDDAADTFRRTLDHLRQYSGEWPQRKGQITNGQYSA